MDDECATPQRRGIEAQNRTRLAQFYIRCLKDMGIPIQTVAKQLGIKAHTLTQKRQPASQLRILHPLSKYIQQKAREQY